MTSPSSASSWGRAAQRGGGFRGAWGRGVGEGRGQSGQVWRLRQRTRRAARWATRARASRPGPGTAPQDAAACCACACAAARARSGTCRTVSTASSVPCTAPTYARTRASCPCSAAAWGPPMLRAGWGRGGGDANVAAGPPACCVRARHVLRCIQPLRHRAAPGCAWQPPAQHASGAPRARHRAISLGSRALHCRLLAHHVLQLARVVVALRRAGSAVNGGSAGVLGGAANDISAWHQRMTCRCTSHLPPKRGHVGCATNAPRLPTKLPSR